MLSRSHDVCNASLEARCYQYHSTAWGSVGYNVSGFGRVGGGWGGDTEHCVKEMFDLSLTPNTHFSSLDSV